MELMLFVFAIGYLVIVLIGVVVALMWSIRRKFGFLKTTGVVLATLLIIYAIPFGDHTLGEIKKYQLCREHGGTKIFKMVENVEGFMWARIGEQSKPPYTTYGYNFYETSNPDGRVFRYTKRSDGSVDGQIVNESQARYVVRSDRKEIGAHTIRSFIIFDKQNNRPLAKHDTVAYRGGWLGLGSVVCPYNANEPFQAMNFLSRVLSPRKTTP